MIGKFLKFGVPLLALIALLSGMIWASRGLTLELIDTRGIIAQQQRQILYFASGVMAIIIVPVFLLLFGIAWKYRATNTKSRYMPSWSENRWLESVWWGIPILVVGVLSVVTWRTSHSLDPYTPLASSRPPLTIQVIALQWRWLFVYPDQRVASINELVIPVDQPVSFAITSDAPMNSFWIPQLGGQIYAMSGMSTQLHLRADRAGNYRGMSANISGSGHADMDFVTRAVSEADFAQWVIGAATSTSYLDSSTYETLRRPSHESQIRRFALNDAGVFGAAINRYGHSGHGGMYAR